MPICLYTYIRYQVFVFLFSLLQDEPVRWLFVCFWVLVSGSGGKHILVLCQSCNIFISSNDDLSDYLQFCSRIDDSGVFRFTTQLMEMPKNITHDL